MSRLSLQSFHKIEPHGLYEVRACIGERDSPESGCTTLKDHYMVTGEHEGMLRNPSGTAFFVPQRAATDLQFMKSSIMHGKQCLHIDPCDDYVKPLCCTSSTSSSSSSTSTSSASTAPAAAPATGSKTESGDRIWLILGIILIVSVVLLLLSLVGVAYYVSRPEPTGF